MGDTMTEPEVTQQLVEWVRRHYFGKYRGVVTDNADPTARGRLKIRVPAVLDTLEIWAMPCVPYAGAGVGFYSLPEPNTGVWIEFEGGDPSYPVWVGCFWADSELPDAGGADIKIWRTQKLTVRLDDGADELKLETGSNAAITMNAEVTTATASGAEHVVGSSVISSSLGSSKVEVTAAAVTVNNGALEVT
jgi:uncharacterized protein involved in type VI secretion and phage assembly